jgi:hypothetical protein
MKMKYTIKKQRERATRKEKKNKWKQRREGMVCVRVLV